MKKTLLVLLAGLIVFFSALPVFAVDIKVNGDFRVRGFYIDNVTDAYDTGTTGAPCSAGTDCNDEAAYNSMRFLLTTTATAGLATGVVTLDFTSANSTGNLRMGGGGITGGEADVAVGPADDRFALVEAYIKADLRVATFSAGRQSFKLGHGIIFDDSADGFVLDAPVGPLKVTVADLKLRDNTDSGVVFIGNTPIEGTGSDTDFYAGNFSFRPTGDIATNLFFGYFNDRGTNLPTGANDANVFIVGGTADANLGPLTLGGEIDFLTGEANIPPETDLEGLNIQVSGGASVGPANVGLTLVYASGDDPADADININGIDGNYPLGFILTNSGARSLQPKDGTCLSQDGAAIAGALGCIAGSGLFAIKGTGSISPIDRLSLQGDIIYAKSAEDFSTANPNDDIGVELDGTARFKLDDNLSLMGGIGYLMTGDWWKLASTDPDPDNIILLVGEMSYHF